MHIEFAGATEIDCITVALDGKHLVGRHGILAYRLFLLTAIHPIRTKSIQHQAKSTSI
jgi:hypothetical protein